MYLLLIIQALARDSHLTRQKLLLHVHKMSLITPAQGGDVVELVLMTTE